MIRFIRFVLFFAFINLTNVVYGQYEGLIYAEVILKDRSSVSGAVRWSGGQMLWTDILLVAKTEQYALKYLNKSQIDALNNDNEGLDWEFMNLWKERIPERQSERLCRFGDIASIHVTGSDQAQLYLKSGSKLRVSTDRTESRHLGKDIAVYNGSLKKIAWDKISRVNFGNCPDNFDPFNSQLLYGTISTNSGELTGFIQWDKVKFLTSQKLEGKPNDESKTDTEYPFRTIRSIEKRDKGAIIKLSSDKKIFLKNNRDVNASNRGIVVMHPSWGRAIVEWEAFRSVRFKKVPPDLGFSTYAKAKRIYGTVSTSDGEIFKGNCTFDLDEEWDVELLEGTDRDIHYQIPFRHVKKIVVSGRDYSHVTLKDDRVLTMNNHNDVTNNNWGVIAWMANSRHKYIPWNKIKEISFR